MSANITVGVKVWLALGERGFLGRGRYMLLKSIRRTASIKGAAASMGLSEKTAHRAVRKMERIVGKPLVRRTRGGPAGGGSSTLTPLAEKLLADYDDAITTAGRRLGGKP